MRTLLITMLLVVFGVATQQAFAEDNKLAGKISGYLFGDYYYMVGADTAASRGASQFSSTPKDMQGFLFRRLYVIYDQPLSEKFAMQTTFEANDKSLDGKSRFIPYIKTAFLEWKDIIKNSNMRLGLIPTLDWTYTEKIWNYRPLEKTLMDMRGCGLATDLGVSLRGMIDQDIMLSYGLMISNGAGFAAENNRYKKFSGEILFKPFSELSFEILADFQPAALSMDTTSIKAMLSYQNDHFTIGGEFLHQTRGAGGTQLADVVPQGISLFAWAPIPGIDNVNIVARYDMWDPDTKNTTSGFKEGFVEAGFDYMPIPNVHFMPNVWMNSYSSKASATRSADVVARLSFYYVYR